MLSEVVALTAVELGTILITAGTGRAIGTLGCFLPFRLPGCIGGSAGNGPPNAFGSACDKN